MAEQLHNPEEYHGSQEYLAEQLMLLNELIVEMTEVAKEEVGQRGDIFV